MGAGYSIQVTLRINILLCL